MNRIEGLLYAFGNCLECSQGYDVTELRKHNVVYDVSMLFGYHRSFFIAFDVVSAWRYHHIKGLRGSNARLLFVFDEAHTVFSSELCKRTAGTGEKPLLLEVYTMMREFGIGVFCLTQSPRSLDETTVLSNSAIKIVKNLNDGKDVLAIGTSLGLNPEQFQLCGMLDKREAIARMSHRYPKPFLFEVPHIAVNKQVDWQLVDRIMKPRLASLHASPPVTPPRPKPAKAQGPSKNDITKVKQLLFDIYNAPYKPVSDRYKQVFGSAGGLGNRIKNLALQWQYAKEIKIHTGNRSGLKIFLVLTPNGYQLICMPPQQRQGIGDFEHQYWQHCLFEECCNRGYAPIKELQIRGKRVDVGLRFPKLIAMEVATTPANELSNVQKDLKSGFDLIVICATTKNVQAKVESILLQHLKPQDWVHVEVCTVQDYLQQTAWF